MSPAKNRRQRARRTLTQSKQRASTSSVRLFSRIGSFLRIVTLSLLIFASFVGAVFVFVLPQIFSLDQPKNIIIVSKDLERSEAVLFAHISPQTQRTIVAVLDGSDKVEVLGGYGQYSIKALYTLLQLDGKDDHFLRAAFSNALGVLVDQVLVVDGLTEKQAVTAELATLLQPLVLQEGSVIPLKDRLQLYFSARTYRSNEVRPQKVEEIAPLLGAHPLISESAARECQVAVVNTTTSPGLALGVSQLLENSGAFVVRVTSDSSRLERSVFISPQADGDCAAIITRAAQLFPYNPTVERTSELPERYRADLVILAGLDVAEATVSE